MKRSAPSSSSSLLAFDAKKMDDLKRKCIKKIEEDEREHDSFNNDAEGLANPPAGTSWSWIDVSDISDLDNIQSSTDTNDFLFKYKDLLSQFDNNSNLVYKFIYENLKIDFKPDVDHASLLSHVLNSDVNVIYLEGLPGSGKSALISMVRRYLIHGLVEMFNKNSSTTNVLVSQLKLPKKTTSFQLASKMIAVTAATGPAAVRIPGAITFHSLFGGADLKYGVFDNMASIPRKCFETIPPIRVVILDELSMIHPLEFVNAEKIFRMVKNKNAFFGGVRTILSGDFYQLKSVIKKDDFLKMCVPKSMKGKVPYIFDTECWKMVIRSKGFRHVNLTKSFRQANEEREFLDLLKAVKYNNLTDKHIKLLRSRVMPFEAFCAEVTSEQISDEMLAGFDTGKETNFLSDIERRYGKYIRVIYRSNAAANEFNDLVRSKLLGTEFTYVCNFILSAKTASQINALIDAEQLPNGTSSTAGSCYPGMQFATILGDNFRAVKLPCEILMRDGIPVSEFQAGGSTTFATPSSSDFMHYYCDDGVISSQYIIRMIQRSDSPIGTSNIVTHLKLHCRVSLTKNISTDHELVNGSEGIVIDFMSVSRFMSISGSRKLKTSVFINESRNYDPTRLKKNWFLLDKEGEEGFTDYRIFHGFAKTDDNSSLNSKFEKFPVVLFARESGPVVVLVMPTLTEVFVKSKARQQNDEERFSIQMQSSLHAMSSKKTDDGQMAFDALDQDNMDFTTHMKLVQKSTRAMSAEDNLSNFGKSGFKTYALYLPLQQCSASTIHKVQGLTVDKLYLGMTESMDTGMFFVALTRVRRLSDIAWAMDPSSLIQVDERVVQFSRDMEILSAMSSAQQSLT